MKIGVIGGSGFIGSHLVDKLVSCGHNVTVLDIMKPHREDVVHVYIDITDLSRTTVTLAGAFDAVYLLAAIADVNDAYRNPVETSQVNIMGVANVLEAARRNNIGRLILASTIWVYGLTPTSNVSEDTPLKLDNTNDVYTSTKVAAELLCHSYQKLYQQNFTILRYGIPYGPRARGGSVLATFVARALKGEPLIIMGDSSQYRRFVYVEDLAAGNVAALKDIAINNVYNLDGMRPVTVREVAETVQRLVGKTKIEYRETRATDFCGRTISSEKARKELGWEPKVSFEEGARRYIEWYKANSL
jgi:UDP-glucose 4-epimerase